MYSFICLSSGSKGNTGQSITFLTRHGTTGKGREAGKWRGDAWHWKFALPGAIVWFAWLGSSVVSTFGDIGRWHYEGHLTTFVSPKYMICNNMYFFIYIYTHMWREREREQGRQIQEIGVLSWLLWVLSWLRWWIQSSTWFGTEEVWIEEHPAHTGHWQDVARACAWVSGDESHAYAGACALKTKCQQLSTTSEKNMYLYIYIHISVLCASLCMG